MQLIFYKRGGKCLPEFFGARSYVSLPLSTPPSSFDDGKERFGTARAWTDCRGIQSAFTIETAQMVKEPAIRACLFHGEDLITKEAA